MTKCNSYCLKLSTVEGVDGSDVTVGDKEGGAPKLQGREGETKSKRHKKPRVEAVTDEGSRSVDEDSSSKDANNEENSSSESEEEGESSCSEGSSENSGEEEEEEEGGSSEEEIKVHRNAGSVEVTSKEKQKVYNRDEGKGSSSDDEEDDVDEDSIPILTIFVGNLPWGTDLSLCLSVSFCVSVCVCVLPLVVILYFLTFCLSVFAVLVVLVVVNWDLGLFQMCAAVPVGLEGVGREDGRRRKRGGVYCSL